MAATAPDYGAILYAEVLRLARGNIVLPAARLDDLGRCCGRKPLTYRRTRALFCCRCNREFDDATLTQRANFSWRAVPGGFVPSSTLAGAAAATMKYRELESSGMSRDDAKHEVQKAIDRITSVMEAVH